MGGELLMSGKSLTENHSAGVLKNDNCLTRTSDHMGSHFMTRVTGETFSVDQLIVNIRFQPLSVYCWFSVTCSFRTSAFSWQKKKSNEDMERRKKEIS